MIINHNNGITDLWAINIVFIFRGAVKQVYRSNLLVLNGITNC